MFKKIGVGGGDVHALVNLFCPSIQIDKYWNLFRDLQAELTGRPRKRKIKEGAIPNLYSKPNKIRKVKK